MRTEAEEQDESARLLTEHYPSTFAEFRADLADIHPGISLARVIELSRKYRPTTVVEG